jgi:hypothetical protein
LFSKDLDAAYLAHKAVLPVQNNAEELLVKLFGDTIADLLHYTLIAQYIQNELIDNWINSNIIDEQFIVNTKNFQRTQLLIKNLITSNKENIKDRFNDFFNGTNLSNKEKEDYVESRTTTKLFLPTIKHEKADNINVDFAKLTHYKSLFLPPKTQPILTLGTVIKSMANPNDYFVCIQQRCDSVRLTEEPRKFLFLPLKKDTQQFYFITPDGVKLKLNKESYSIETIKFKCNSPEGVIKGTQCSDDKYNFIDVCDSKYEWIMDLKDLRSQKIVADYALQLSRVGIDESEWLRMAGN